MLNGFYSKGQMDVLDGHKNLYPKGSTHAGVTSCESMRITFTHESLNNEDVWACDIQKSCLQDPTTEKHCIVCGQKFGLENEG